MLRRYRSNIALTQHITMTDNMRHEPKELCLPQNANSVADAVAARFFTPGAALGLKMQALCIVNVGLRMEPKARYS